MDRMEIRGSLPLPSCVGICPKSLSLWTEMPSYSDLLPTDSPPTACFAVPASDDPSSCVMVCATPTGGSDLKTKERGGSCLHHQCHGRHILCLPPSLKQRTEFATIGRRKGSCVQFASHQMSSDLWHSQAFPGVTQEQTNGSTQLAEDISLLPCPAYEISPSKC